MNENTMTGPSRFALTLIILVMLLAGGYSIFVSHAATPYTSQEAASGSLTNGATKITSSSATSGSYVQFGTPMAPQSGPLLGALAPTDSNSTLQSDGFRERVISIDWSAIEPSQGVFSASAISAAQSAISSAQSAGLSASLDLGEQYAPSWIFSVGGGTQFKDQYGDIFGGSAGSGNDVANAVTDQAVRAALSTYISYLGSHLSGIDSIRIGGAAYNELRYPSGYASSNGNSYWFYDVSSQASLPSSIQGWKPGTGTVAQATAFLNAYNNALDNYGVWEVQTAESAFPGTVKIELLMPGWGERPSEISPAEQNLLASAPDEIHQGLDWTHMLPELPNSGRTVAYSTYADATQGGGTNPDPAAFIHSILPTGMLQGGESTGNGQTTSTGMDLMFQDAKNWNWYVVNWFFNGQPESAQQVDAAFVAN